MIDFPTSNRHLYDPNAEGYQAPWQDDVTGKEWTWDEAKQRWEPYLSTATSFAELTDKATADLPGINGPLATALGLKADDDHNHNGVYQPAGSYAPAAGIAPSAIAGTAVVDNDARLSDARTPTAHKSSHATGGSDPLSPADIGAVASDPSAVIGATATQITNIVHITQAQYNLLGTPDPNITYIITP